MVVRRIFLGSDRISFYFSLSRSLRSSLESLLNERGLDWIGLVKDDRIKNQIIRFEISFHNIINQMSTRTFILKQFLITFVRSVLDV